MSNSYLVQLKPFENRNDPYLEEFQKKSIEHSLCGMGWALSEFYPDDQKCILSDHKSKFKEAYLRSSKGKANRSLSGALNRYDEMKPGDYVLTRLYRSGDCYVGEIRSKAYLMQTAPAGFPNATNYSWVVDVDWKYIGPFLTIPNTLRGFMQSRMNTIRKVEDNSL